MSETRNQRRIREILGEAEPEQDHSLRAQAMDRATSERVPKTLTPWEWEQWYAEHGAPPAHRQPVQTQKSSLLQRLRLRLFGIEKKATPSNCARLPDEDADF